MIRLGRIRSALLDQVAQPHLTRALESLLPGLERDPVGVGEPQLEDLFGADHPLTAGDGRGQAVEHRGLARLGARRRSGCSAPRARSPRGTTPPAGSGCRARRATAGGGARTVNLRTLTALNPRLMPSSTTCSRWPSGSIASTNGWLRSMRRPELLSIRSTSSCTCAWVSTRLVSSWRPCRATKTRSGALIHSSSTVGSSRNGCSGPNPLTRATSSPTAAATSGTGVTCPVRLRSSCSRTTPSAIRRTSAASRWGSTPSRRTASRTRASRTSTSSTGSAARCPSVDAACVSVMVSPRPEMGLSPCRDRNPVRTTDGSP